MRDSLRSALIILFFWAALALAAARGSWGTAEADSPISTPEPALTVCGETTAPEQIEAGASAPQAERGFDAEYRLPVLRDGQVDRMDLHNYLTGVVLAEMPSSFSPEALKAQAVACRTYTLRSCEHQRHPEAAICTDSGCCQGWRDPAAADPAARARAEAAVSATDGLVICYEGALIDATFFSCSGGRTEDAAAVWGSDLPYLRAVESPGEENAAHYSDELRLTLSDFQAVLKALDPELRFSGNPSSWIGRQSQTSGGGVEEMTLCGRSFRGTELRKAFGLRSTAFRLELTEEEAVFTTRGCGHRVGMSQYGAEAMARAGNDCEAILKWYYTGVELLPAEDVAEG